MSARRHLLACALLAVSVTACSDRQREAPRPEPVPVTIADPARYWAESGFVEMTPPVRLPSRDGRERIRVWLRIPDGGLLGADAGPRGVALTYPPGTVADRADLQDDDDPSSVGDVRGTRFDPDGHEIFHVLRRLEGDGSARLDGLEWPRSDAISEREATATMTARMLRARGLPPDSTPDPELQAFQAQNDCGSCHVHDKPERTLASSREGPPPNRATDAAGLYVVQTVLTDGAPLETHRAREMNEGDRFVTLECGEDGPAPRMASRSWRWRHYVCDDGRVPRGRYDLAGALAAGDEHARAVCRSRAYLHDHMDAAGRAAFAEAFGECGL